MMNDININKNVGAWQLEESNGTVSSRDSFVSSLDPSILNSSAVHEEVGHVSQSPLKKGPLEKRMRLEYALAQSTNSAQSTTDKPENIFADLEKWGEQASGGSRENYQRVAKQILAAWQNQEQTSLTITDAKIISLPAMPPQLKFLDVSFCGELRSPPSLLACVNLEEFKAKHCSQMATPPNFDHCSNLKLVDFSGCNLIDLPSFKNCSKLVKLNVKGIDIQDKFISDLLKISKGCTVNLNRSLLSPWGGRMIQEAVNADGYEGPKFEPRLEMEKAQISLQLKEKVQSWLKNISN